MATRRILINGQMLAGGWNDTSFPNLRQPNQAKQLENMKINQNNSLEQLNAAGTVLKAAEAGATNSLITPASRLTAIDATVFKDGTANVGAIEDGASIAGTYLNGNWYFSDGTNNFVQRGDAAAKKNIDNAAVASIAVTEATAGNSNAPVFGQEQSWTDEKAYKSIALSAASTILWGRVRCYMNLTGADPNDWYIEVGVTITLGASYSKSYLVGVIYPEDITIGVGPGSLSYVDLSPPEPIIIDKTINNGVGTLLIEATIVEIDGPPTLLEAPCKTNSQDANGDFDDWGMSITTFQTESNAGRSYAYTLVNVDGTETQLSDPISAVPTGAGSRIEGNTITFTLATDAADYDIAYLRLYKAPMGSNVFYLVGQTTTSRLNIAEGINDSQLGYRYEANSVVSRTGKLAYTHAVWWDNRLWVFDTGADDGTEHVIYFSETYKPEVFNLANGWIPVGMGGSPITAAAAIADQLVVFKNNGYWAIRPMGNSYTMSDLNQSSVGTPTSNSVIPAMTAKGPMVFFQGPDYSLRATNGVRAINLSSNRLSQTMNSTLGYATAVGYYPLNDEIFWCFGTKGNIVYNVVKDAFEKETVSASIIGTGWNGTNTIIVDAGGLKNYRGGTGRLTYTFETSDIDFGDQDSIKRFISVEIAGSSLNGATLTWYVDQVTSPTGTQELGGTTGTYRIAINGLGKEIRLKLTDAESSVTATISYISIEFVEFQDHRRL